MDCGEPSSGQPGSSRDQHDLADVLARSAMIRWASGASANGTASWTTGATVPSASSRGSGVDPRLQRAAVVPQREHVQPDDRLGVAHLLDQVEAAEHAQRPAAAAVQQVALLARVDATRRRRRPAARRGAAARRSAGTSGRRSRRGRGRAAAGRFHQPSLAVVDRVVDAELARSRVLAGRRGAVDLGAAPPWRSASRRCRRRRPRRGSAPARPAAASRSRAARPRRSRS